MSLDSFGSQQENNPPSNEVAHQAERMEVLQNAEMERRGVGQAM